MGFEFPISNNGDRYSIGQRSYQFNNNVWVDNEFILPEHHWKFNELSGSIYVSDSGSIAKALVATGTTVYPTLGNAGKLVRSAYITGANARFESFSAEAVTISAITISQWININLTTSGLSYSRYQDTNNYVYVGFRYQEDPLVALMRMNFGGVVADYNVFLFDGKWHHVVTRYKATGSVGRLDYFIDGVHVFSTETAYKVVTFNATTNRNAVGMHWIGNYRLGAATNPLNGYIEDVRVYYRALSDLDIFALYNKELGTKSQCLVHGYPTYRYPQHQWKFYENTQEGTSIKISDSGNLPVQLNYNGSSLNINNSGLTINEVNTIYISGNGTNESYSAFTVSFWVSNNFDSSSPTDEILILHYSGSTQSNVIRVSFRILDGDYPGIDVSVNGFTGLSFVISSSDYSHFAVVYDGISVTIYKNTIALYTFSNITGVSNFSTNSIIHIGGCFKDYLSTTYSIINDIRLYNYALSKEEIENIYYLGIQNKIT